MEEFLLQEGIETARRGDKELASILLRQALELNPRSITAWLWLSGVVETDQERRRCLEAVLLIDPDNQAAQYGLAKLAAVPLPGSGPTSLLTEPPSPAGGEVLQGILQELRQISEQLRDLSGGLRPIGASLAALESARATAEPETPAIKTALFVDFDNIYLGLKAIDQAAAERFATDPARWLKWIERGMPSAEGSAPQPPPGREVLIRNCYLNPRTFHQFRPYFTRSAFSVIDCPPLTTQGKTSSDIRMVMDILATLQHRTQFDEFIILSGDADFTPVLFQLRANNYRTTVVAIGPAAEAYTAACDRVIIEDTFIEDALGSRWEASRADAGAAPGESEVAPEILDGMALRVYEEASASNEILATELPRIYKEYPEFKQSTNWLGFASLRALTQELARRHPDLSLVEGDPWRVVVRSAPPGQIEHDLNTRILARVREIVADADEPVSMGKAAHLVISDLGPQVTDSNWAGTGSFKNFLVGVQDPGFEILVAPNTPGYLFDPERHERPPVDLAGDELRGLAPELVTFIRRVSQVTGAPALSPRQYRVVFDAIADDVGQHPYNIIRTSKAVRDLCIERGEPIARKNVSFILRGISYTGHRFGEADNAFTLSRIFRGNVLALIGDAQLELTEDERALLDKWIQGGFAHDA